MEDENLFRDYSDDEEEDKKDDKDLSFASALKRSVQTVHLRDLFLSLINLSSELQISDFAADQSEFTKILKMHSQVLHDFLEMQIKETPFTKQISSIRWP